MRFRPARAPSLDQDRVVRAALALIDDVGLEGLTMRRLADELGVQAASLYWHFRDKEELLDLLASAIASEVPEPRSEGPWREQLEIFALGYRRVLQGHRDAALLVAGRIDAGAGTRALMEAVTRPLLEAGLGPQDAAAAAFLLASYVPRFTAGPGPAAPADTSGVSEATPLGSARSGRLEFVSGASRVSIRADPTMRVLYRTSFEGREPGIQVDGGTVRVSQRHGRKGSGELVVNGSIPWEVAVKGGAVKVTADLSALRLTSFEVSGGAVLLSLTLPAPTGTAPIRFSGGMRRVEIHRPEGVPVRLRVAGGAVRLTLDESSFGGIGGEARLQTAGYQDATDRYDIEVVGGAARLTVDRAEVGAAPAAGPVAHDADHASELDAEARFRFGLEVLLDGLERRLPADAAEEQSR